MTELEIYAYFMDAGGIGLSTGEVQAIKRVLNGIVDELRHKPLLDAYIKHIHLSIMIEAVDMAKLEENEQTAAPFEETT